MYSVMKHVNGLKGFKMNRNRASCIFIRFIHQKNEENTFSSILDAIFHKNKQQGISLPYVTIILDAKNRTFKHHMPCCAFESLFN